MESDDFLSDIVRDEEVPIHICVGIREDELFRLARLRKINPFQNLITLPDLDLENAREAIWGPIKDLPGVFIGDRFEDFLSELWASRRDGPGKVLAADLAIVCYQHWELHRKGGVLFSREEIAKEGFEHYCRTTLERIEMEANPSYCERVSSALLALSTGARLTVAGIAEKSRFGADELSYPLTDLLKYRLVEHDTSMGSYWIAHQLLVRPIQNWVATRGSHTESLSRDITTNSAALMALNEDNEKLNNRIRMTDHVLRLVAGSAALEELTPEIIELWPKLKGDAASRSIMRHLAAYLEAPVSDERSIDVAGLNWRENLIELSDNRILLTRSPIHCISFTRDRKQVQNDKEDPGCIAAYDELGFVYLWDLSGKLLLHRPGTADMFAALLMTPEEIYEKLAASRRVDTVGLRPVPQDRSLEFTFNDLTGDG